MNDNFDGKTVLVTGGTGSIGSEIVRQSLDNGADRVIVFGRDEFKQLLLAARQSDERLHTCIGDIKDYNSIQRIFAHTPVDIIYHAAAMKHVNICEAYPIEGVKTNILGTQNLINCAQYYHVPQLVFISTDKAVHPANVMGASKFIAERIVLNAGYTCVRFGNVANSRGSVIPILIDDMIHKKKLRITDPGVTRFVMGIPDAVRLIFKATRMAHGRDIFILKMDAFKLSDLFDVMINRIAPMLHMNPSEIDVETVGLVEGEKMHEDLVNNMEKNRLFELDDMYVILDPARMHLYSNMKAANSVNYTSDSVRLITKEQIESIIVDYLKNTMYDYNFISDASR
jgi:UDP-N-acetylglucosamine 4,6-dehydratase